MRNLRFVALAVAVAGKDCYHMRNLRFVVFSLAVGVVGEDCYRMRNLCFFALAVVLENCNRMCKLRLVALAVAAKDCNRIRMPLFVSSALALAVVLEDCNRMGMVFALAFEDSIGNSYFLDHCLSIGMGLHTCRMDLL